MAKGEGKRAKQRKIDICRERIIKYRELILNGRFIAVDPSSVSAGKDGSKPGYAIFENGVLLEQGWINVTYHADLAVRLRRVHEAFTREFENEKFDIVIIENPPIVPIFSKAAAEKKGKTFMNVAAVNALARACGSIIAAFPSTVPMIEMNPILWHHTAKKNGWEIDKKDDTDAYLMGLTAITLAKGITSAEEE